MRTEHIRYMKEVKKYSSHKIWEAVMHVVFLAAACISIVAVALICIFLFANGIPAIAKIGAGDFLLGTKWKPGNNIFGIFR